MSLSLRELQARCRQLGLKQRGRKQELVDRLLAHQGAEEGTSAEQQQQQQEEKRHEPPVWLYIPNLIGYTRLALTLLSIGFLSRWPPLFIALNTLAIVLDFFDGMLARRLQQCSKFGEVLDVVVDNVQRTLLYGIVVYDSGVSREEKGDAVAPWMLVLCVVLICTEWLCFACTHAMSLQQDAHWKHNVAELPPILHRIFRNHFRNWMGVWVISGLWVWPSFLVLRILLRGGRGGQLALRAAPSWLQTSLQAINLVLMLGRLLCLYAELSLIRQFFQGLLVQDEARRKGKQ